jgi:hypothetical protein
MNLSPVETANLIAAFFPQHHCPVSPIQYFKLKLSDGAIKSLILDGNS